MEQPGAAASGAGGGSEEPGGGRSNKRSAGNRAANEEETKNKPKLVSAPAAPAGLGDSESPRILRQLRQLRIGGSGAPPKANRDLAVLLGEPRRLRGGGRAPPSSFNPFLTRIILGGSVEKRRAPPQLGETRSTG